MSRHKILSLLAGGVILWLLATEIPERYANAYRQIRDYSELSSSEEPDSSLASTVRRLATERDSLKASFIQAALYSKSQAGLVKFLSEEAASSQVRLSSLRPKDPVVENGLRRLLISGEVRGQFSRLGRYIEGLETSLLPATIRSLELSSESGGGLIRATFEVEFSFIALE